MGSSCTRGIAENVREELWSYFALSGLLFLNIGIVLVVYALKRATPYPVVLEVFGLGLIIMGVLTTLASWYIHRQHRKKKPLFTCTFSCSKNSQNLTHETSETASTNKSRQNNLYSPGAMFLKSDKTRLLDPVPQHTIKMFSTPEFQKYDEYMKRDTAGVEVNGANKFKVDSLRQKKYVHPQPPTGTAQATTFVKAVYTEEGHVISQPMTVASPILLKLSH